MLSSADLAVVGRDPGLTGLRLLLDADALTDRLARRLGPDCAVIPHRLRYKPGTSCVLAFDLRRPGRPPVPCIARAYAAHAAAKLGKGLRGLAEHDVLAVDEADRLAATTIVGDRHLGGPSRLFSDRTARGALLRRVLPDRPDLHDAPIRTLRHNPERRWVGLLDDPDRPVVLRGFRTATAGNPLTAYATLADGRPPTPALLGTSRKRGMVAVSWAPGRVLTVDAKTDAFHAAGAALALLHTRSHARLAPAADDAQVAQLLKTRAQVGDLMPSLRDLVDDVLTALLDRHPGVPSELVALHGDFSPDQVVLDDAGEATLIDLDAAHLGDPAHDLGSAWAAALVAGDHPDGDVEDRVGALLTGYATVRRLPALPAIAWYRDCFLLRRAAEGFRTRRPDWAGRMTRCVWLAAHGAGPAPERLS